MEVVQRMRRALMGVTAATVGAAMLALVPAGPASAADPSVVGDYATQTSTVLRTIRGLECTEPVSVRTAANLQGLGAAIEAKGFYTSSGKPVYTALNWDSEFTITGPDNFYARYESSSQTYPTSEGTAAVELCPDDFGTSKVSPGVYTVSGRAWAFSYRYSGEVICHATVGCLGYDKLWEQTFTQTITLGFSQTCLEARAKAPVLSKAVRKAKALLKKAKKTRNPAKIRKAKKRLKRAKASYARNRTIISNSC